MEATDSADREAKAWQLYDRAIRSAETALREMDLLTKQAAEMGTEVRLQDERVSTRPGICLNKLKREFENDRISMGKFYEQYREAQTPAEKSEAFVRLACSNVGFYESIWTNAKRSSGVIYFLKNVEVPPGTASSTQQLDKEGRLKRKATIKIDIVAQGGTEWVKVLNIHSRRLLHKMAGAGWDWDWEEDDGPGLLLPEGGESTGIEVLDSIKGLVIAAESSRSGPYNYTSPSIRVVLGRLKLGEDRHIDRLLRLVENMGTARVGVKVECGPDIEDEEQDAKPLRETLGRMIPTYDTHLGSEVNLDCTVLFNIGSDTSHVRPDDFDAETLRQGHVQDDLHDEKANGPRILTDMYPFLRRRQMICTEFAAQNYWSTVLDIGSPTEIERLRIIMPSPSPSPPTNSSPEERQALREALQNLSCYPVPDDLILPIRVVRDPTREEVSSLVEKGELPDSILAMEKMEKIKPVTLSTLWQAFVGRQSTITSNKAGMNFVNSVTGPGGFGPSQASFLALDFGRRLAAKPKPR